MEVLLGITGFALSYVILYFVVKAAVRNGILEARSLKERRTGDTENAAAEPGTAISQVICPHCGKGHDMDYPKCPYCGHRY